MPNNLIRKSDKTGSEDLPSGSDCVHFLRMRENIHVFHVVATSRSPRETARETGISCGSVVFTRFLFTTI